MGRVKQFPFAHGPDHRNIRSSFRPSRKYDPRRGGGWSCRPCGQNKHVLEEADKRNPGCITGSREMTGATGVPVGLTSEPAVMSFTVLLTGSVIAPVSDQIVPCGTGVSVSSTVEPAVMSFTMPLIPHGSAQALRFHQVHVHR